MFIYAFCALRRHKRSPARERGVQVPRRPSSVSKASVAQRAVRRTFNPVAPGSSSGGGTPRPRSSADERATQKAQATGSNPVGGNFLENAQRGRYPRAAERRDRITPLSLGEK